jgi:hypothetical protein
MRSSSTLWKFAIAFLVLLGIAVSQSSHRTRILVINGHSGDAIVYEIDGKSFVDLESLVRIGNGSLAFRNEQIVLTLPPAPDEHTAPPADSSRSAIPGMSPDFMKAAVQDLAIIKDWTNVMAYAVQRGVPGDGARLQIFRDRAAQGLRLAKVAATTDSDQSALILLTNQFNTVAAWNDQLVGERKSMDTGKYSMSENGLNGDANYQKISNCTKFLSTMLPSGQFQDDNSCH